MNLLRATGSYRCDEPMRSRKEKGYTRDGRRWRCRKDCMECICCLIKLEDGTWEHIDFTKERRKTW